jgi:hypothetical protein
MSMPSFLINVQLAIPINFPANPARFFLSECATRLRSELSVPPAFKQVPQVIEDQLGSTNFSVLSRFRIEREVNSPG